MVGNGPPAPSALLKATTRVFFLFVGKIDRLGQQFQAAFENAITAFPDSFLDKLWVLAGAGARSCEPKLGADKDSNMMILQIHEDQQVLVFTILEQIVQV